METDPFDSSGMEDNFDPQEPIEPPLLSREQFESVERQNTVSRRKAIGWTALGTAAAAGLFSQTELGRRVLSEGAGRLQSLRDLAEDRWHELNTRERGSTFARQERPLQSEAEYHAFLAKIPLRYITPAEIIRPHRNVRNGIENCIPPQHMWDRIALPLKVADEIRHRLGRSLYCINSAYRCPAYNAECSGAASQSYHMQNKALDLMFTGGPEAAAEVAGKLRDEDYFRGGIGIYSNFIHIDTRGYDASWGA